MLTKYAAVADLHLNNHKAFGGITVNGINERGGLCLETLECALQIAEDRGCTDFVVCGDVFDHIRPGPQLIAAVGRLLAMYTMKKWIIVGNHDQVSEAPGDHVLGPLGLVDGVTIIDKPTMVGDAMMLPYRRGKVTEWLPEELKRHSPNMIFAHFGIITGDTPAFLRDAEDAIHCDSLYELMKDHEIKHVVVGNWHRPKVITYPGEQSAAQHCIWQCGSLIPSGFDDVECDGYVVIVDEKSSGERAQPEIQPHFASMPWRSSFVPDWERDDKKRRRGIKDGQLPSETTFVRCHSVPFTELAHVYEVFERARTRGVWRDFEIEVGTSDARELASPVSELRRNRSQLAQDYIRSVYSAETNAFREEILRRLTNYGAT